MQAVDQCTVAYCLCKTFLCKACPETKETQCKPFKELNVRLTRGSSPIYPRFITSTASALRCWLLTSVPTPIVFVNPFRASHVRESYLSSSKPGHTTGGSGRQGAGRTAGRGDAGQNNVTIFWMPWKPTAPLALQRTVNNCLERLFASTNKKKSYVNRGGNKTSG